MMTGNQLKLAGLDLVELHNRKWMDIIRDVARRICRECFQVSADDLHQWADDHDCHPGHRNAWGAVFRGNEWTVVGYKHSEYPSNHARLISVWCLKVISNETKVDL